MAVLRAQFPTSSYKTTVKRTLVNALRDVFIQTYPEADFQGLNVVTQFPLTEIEYPAVIIQFNETRLPDAGVGHREHFPDPFGDMREWKHRRYEGNIEFTAAALSPLDRDVLSDALIEVLAFGDLDPLQNGFFVRVYGHIGVNVGTLGLLHQISLGTGDIRPGGESANIAPWEPEDVLVYTNSYTIACNGGFYNSVPQVIPAAGYIQALAPIIANIDIDEPDAFDHSNVFDDDPSNQWSYVFDYEDTGYVLGAAIIGTTDHFTGTTYDVGRVKGIGVIGSTEAHTFAPDAAVVIGQAVIGSEDVAHTVDATTVISTGVMGTVDTYQPVDAATVVGTGVPAADDRLSIYLDAESVTGVGVIGATEVYAGADAATITSTAVIGSTDSRQELDADTAISVGVATATDTEATVDAQTVVSVGVVGSADVYVSGSGDASLFRSDSGIGTEASTLKAVVSRPEPGAGTETSTQRAVVGRTDSGTGTDASKKGLHGTETPAGTDTSSVLKTIQKTGTTNAAQSTDTSTRAPFIDDRYARTVTNGFGTTDTGQSYVIDQGDIAEFSVAPMALPYYGRAKINIPSGNAPIIHVNVNMTYSDHLYLYSFNTQPTGSLQTMGPTWWFQGSNDYYRLTITQTTGLHTSLSVQQQIAGVNTSVPMNWGSGNTTSDFTIASQVPTTKYWCRMQVINLSGTKTFRVKVWQENTGEPNVWLGTGADIAGGTKHGAIGYRGQTLSSNTNHPTYSFFSTTVLNLA